MRKFVIFITAVLLLAAAGYGALDAYDRVPGILTTRPAVAQPADYPSVSASPEELDQLIPAVEDVPAASVSAAADDFVAAAQAIGAELSVTVRDAATGQELYADGADTALAPASSLKLLTAAAALYQLGPQTRLATTATWDGTTLTLVGGGDVLLTAGPSTGEANGYASLEDLAQQAAAALQELGVTQVRLAVDDTAFTGSPYGADWDAVDTQWVMPVAALAVDHGQISETSYVSDPALDAAQQFAAALQDAGVEVISGPSQAASDDDARVVATVSSASVAELVRYTLKESDNSVAEVLARLVALSRGQAGTAAAGASAVVAVLGELGVDTSGIQLADACGLSSTNRVTARLLADVVLEGLEEPRLQSVISALPVAALDGTLADRIDDAAGLVRAKTGTLAQTVSLTGIVQPDDGSTLVFSLLASDFESGSAWEVREVLDEFVAQMAHGNVEP